MGETTRFEILKEYCIEHKKKSSSCGDCKYASLCDEISRLLGLDIYDIKKEE